MAISWDLININPFQLDLSTHIGIVVLLLLVGMAVLLFFLGARIGSGAIQIYIFFVLLYNGINFLISILFLVFGLITLFSGKST